MAVSLRVAIRKTEYEKLLSVYEHHTTICAKKSTSAASLEGFGNDHNVRPDGDPEPNIVSDFIPSMRVPLESSEDYDPRVNLTEKNVSIDGPTHVSVKSKTSVAQEKLPRVVLHDQEILSKIRKRFQPKGFLCLLKTLRIEVVGSQVQSCQTRVKFKAIFLKKAQANWLKSNL